MFKARNSTDGSYFVLMNPLNFHAHILDNNRRLLGINIMILAPEYQFSITLFGFNVLGEAPQPFSFSMNRYRPRLSWDNHSKVVVLDRR